MSIYGEGNKICQLGDLKFSGLIRGSKTYSDADAALRASGDDPRNVSHDYSGV